MIRKGFNLIEFNSRQGRLTSGHARTKLRAAVLRRDPLCVRCLAAGRATVSTEADHIVPVHKGGSNDLSNMQGLCADCHRRKTADDLGKVATEEYNTAGEPTDPYHPWNQGR